MQSIYSPTPTIIEAARALYANHSVADISRTSDDSRATNLTHTTEALNSIIDNTIARKEKAICFLTGVPGAGKTLVGLNIAIQRRGDVDPSERAVFLSGNVPLVRVLQKALYDDVSAKREKIKELLKERGEENRIPELVENYRDQAIEKRLLWISSASEKNIWTIHLQVAKLQFLTNLKEHGLVKECIINYPKDIPE